jgi:hypothetical protein
VLSGLTLREDIADWPSPSKIVDSVADIQV